MTLFPRESRSLLGEIVDWMLVPLLVIWPMGVVLTHLVAQNIAALPFDRELEQTIRTVASLVQLNGPSQREVILRSVNDFLRMDSADGQYFQVRQNNRLIAGEANLPLPPRSSEGNFTFGDMRMRDAVMQNLDLRIAWVWLDTPPHAPDTGPMLVQVAETLVRRKRLANEITKGVTLPQFFVVPLALLLVLVALSRNMRPLQALERQVRKRASDDFGPLGVADVAAQTLPQEVQPLVGAMNGLLQRLQLSVRNEKRFLADAAHQLKTPLAGLRMQAELAERESDSPADIKRSLHNIAAASVRATHVVNQLLALARAEGVQQVQQRSPCDLAAIARRVAQDLVPHALDKAISLSFEVALDQASSAAFMVRGHAVFLGEMIRNLLSNAINYTPRAGHVIVRVLRVADAVEVQVQDDGPGIPKAEHELVFQPFYRSLGTQAEGSGLGLAIVQKVVQQHEARLLLEAVWDNQTRPGLRVRVLFKNPTMGDDE